MPWKVATKMDEREKLVRKWNSGLYGVSELAEEFGVSRPTVYQWTKRFECEGKAGLIDRAPVAKSCPHRTEAEVAQQIIDAKRCHPDWGPAKLMDFLTIEKPDVDWPAPSTAGRILDQQGLVMKRRRRSRTGVIPYASKIEAEQSGEMMTADHKGQIRMLNGHYCYPVTINEPVSRFIYAVEAKTSTSYEQAKVAFDQVFQEYGIPYFMGTDNGNPFSCSRSLAGLSRMAIWWIKLGITPVRIHKGCPWENGIHERMHRTLKAATARPPGADMREQQKKFDAFRNEFNTVRPHESLFGRRPAESLKRCARSYPRRIASVEYPAHYETRSVRSKGQIKWNSSDLFVSQALIRERVGLVEIDDGIWSIYFSTVEIGRYDQRTKSII